MELAAEAHVALIAIAKSNKNYKMTCIWSSNRKNGHFRH